MWIKFYNLFFQFWLCIRNRRLWNPSGPPFHGIGKTFEFLLNYLETIRFNFEND